MCDVMKTFFIPIGWFRIYQDAEMILTKDVTSTKPDNTIEKKNQGKGIENLLDLSPNDIVFYVGGYPDNFTVSSQTHYQPSICLIIGNSFCNTTILLTRMSFVNTILLLLSHQVLLNTRSTKAALSSPPLTTKLSASIISKRQRKSIRRLHARGWSQHD